VSIFKVLKLGCSNCAFAITNVRLRHSSVPDLDCRYVT